MTLQCNDIAASVERRSETNAGDGRSEFTAVFKVVTITLYYCDASASPTCSYVCNILPPTRVHTHTHTDVVSVTQHGTVIHMYLSVHSKTALTICYRTVGVVPPKKLGAKKLLYLFGFDDFET